MHRRSFLKTAGGAALAASWPLGCCAAVRPRRPNILLLMTDQQSADAMSCRIGDRYLHTPAMDGLAAEGTLMSRAYCANPLCMPSRTSTFTGRYPHQTGVLANERNSLDAARFPLMGKVFQAAGYDTGYVGKWHLPLAKSDKATHGFGFMANIKNNGADPASGKPAAEFIRKNRRRPFLLVTSFVNPHNICEWARGQKLPEGPIGRPPPPGQCPPRVPNHGPPAKETDIMALMRRSYQASWVFPVADFDDAKWRQYVWAYYRMIEMVDAEIGRVLDALRQSGQEKNTLVVFTSDHGDCQGAHGWNQKTVFYDESSRVPLILRQPGVTVPGRSNRLVQTGIDLVPTLCRHAGVPLPEGLPGISLAETVRGETAEDPREYLVVSNKMIQGAPIDGVTPIPSGRMVRSRRYKYCLYDQGRRRESLVDMENDPGEMVNLAQSESARQVLHQHRNYLAQWCRDMGDRFPLPEGF